MKTILTTLAVAATTVSCFGQGHVNFVTDNDFEWVSTNNVINYLGNLTGTAGATNGPTQRSSQAPAGYIYALLAQPWDGTSATVNASLANVLTGGWIFTGVTGTNTIFRGNFSGGANALTTAGMPIGGTNQFVVVGWSSTLLGIFNYNSFSNALANTSFVPGGYVGISIVGTGVGVDGTNIPPEEIFNFFETTAIYTGLYLLSTTPAPEPIVLSGASVSNNVFQMTITANPGSNYTIQASTTLVNWLPIYTNISPFIFSDPYTSNYPSRFYRALLGP